MEWPWYAVIPLWLIAIGVLAISNSIKEFLKIFENESSDIADKTIDTLVDKKIEQWAKD